MSEPGSIRAQRYYEQAESLGNLADQEKDPETKGKLLSLAKDYEELSAQVLSRRLKRCDPKF